MIIHEDDKDIFLKILNKSGFLLEDQVWKILDGMSYEELERSKIINHLGERVEIDFIMKQGKHVLVGECKKTDYSWIFSKAIERQNTLNLIYDSHGVKVKTRGTSDFETAWTDIAIMIDENGKIVTQRNQHPQISTQEIHSNIKQILKETGAYLCEKRCLGKIIIPIIVTNAKLYYLKYTKANIDNNSNLDDYESIEETGGVVYNFPEILKWDNNQQIIRNDLESREHHVKSIFIININHLEEFVKKIIDQQL